MDPNTAEWPSSWITPQPKITSPNIRQVIPTGHRRPLRLSTLNASTNPSWDLMELRRNQTSEKPTEWHCLDPIFYTDWDQVSSVWDLAQNPAGLRSMARNRFFGIFEIAEQIFSFLSARELLAVREVFDKDALRQFHQFIDTSSIIQRKIRKSFLKPIWLAIDDQDEEYHEIRRSVNGMPHIPELEHKVTPILLSEHSSNRLARTELYPQPHDDIFRHSDETGKDRVEVCWVWGALNGTRAVCSSGAKLNPEIMKTLDINLVDSSRRSLGDFDADKPRDFGSRWRLKVNWALKPSLRIPTSIAEQRHKEAIQKAMQKSTHAYSDLYEFPERMALIMGYFPEGLLEQQISAPACRKVMIMLFANMPVTCTEYEWWATVVVENEGGITGKDFVHAIRNHIETTMEQLAINSLLEYTFSI